MIDKVQNALNMLPVDEIEKAISFLHSVYERDGRIYVIGNGGSWALAGHWVGDFNKTVFSQNNLKRFQALRLPSSEVELTAWANDAGYENIFLEPLRNQLQETDILVAISSSGSSPNIVKAVEFAKESNVPVIGLSGFEAENQLNQLADAKIHIPTEKGEYEVVESVHGVVLHYLVKYFRDYFNELEKRKVYSL